MEPQSTLEADCPKANAEPRAGNAEAGRPEDETARCEGSDTAGARDGACPAEPACQDGTQEDACCCQASRDDDDPFRPRWADITDARERQCAHIIDMLGFCGHYMHLHGGGRSGRAPILCTLRKLGGQMFQRELMRRFELKAGSLSEVLSKLEKDGLIERHRDEADRRQLVVKLTPAGAAFADEEQTRRERFREGALSCLGDDERDELEGMLARIKEHWRTLDA